MVAAERPYVPTPRIWTLRSGRSFPEACRSSASAASRWVHIIDFAGSASDFLAFKRQEGKGMCRRDRDRAVEIRGSRSSDRADANAAAPWR